MAEKIKIRTFENGTQSIGYWYKNKKGKKQWCGYGITKYGIDIATQLAYQSLNNNDKRYLNFYRKYDDYIVLYVYSRSDNNIYRCLFDIVDEYLLEKYKWYIYSSNAHTRYLRCDKEGLAHRVVLKDTAIPNGYVIDHINLNGLDNRRSNLRILSNSDNKRNMKYYGDKELPLGIIYEDGKYPRYRVVWSTYDYHTHKQGCKRKSKSFTISHYDSKEEALKKAMEFNEKIRQKFYK